MSLELKGFFIKAASVADVAAVIPKSTKILIAKGVSTFFINGKPIFITRPRKLSKPPFRLVVFCVSSN